MSAEANQSIDMDEGYAFDWSTSDRDSPPEKKRRVTASSKAKASRKGKTKTRGKTGRLAFMLDLPTEIVLEIYSYLMPVDVLNLSFVDKELRARLTSTSSVSIWVAARQNVPNLPECPVDFTEWAYARFLFIKTCQLCGGIARGLSEMPFIRIRLCSRCHKKECWSGRSLFEGSSDYTEWKLVPRSVELYHVHTIELLQEFDYPRKHNVAFRPAVSRLRNRLDLHHDEERKEYIDERRAFIEKVMDHALRLSKWLRETQQNVLDDQQAHRETRLESIRTRLAVLGYDRQDMVGPVFTRCRAVYHTADITNRTWPNVLAQVEGIVQGKRDSRLAAERRLRVIDYIRTRFRSIWEALPTDFEKYTFIPFGDFLELPSITGLLTSDVDEDEVPGLFDSILESANEEVEKFRKRMVSDALATWVDRTYPTYGAYYTAREKFRNMDDAAKLAHLRLATTVFTPSPGVIGMCVCTHPLRFSTLFKEPFHGDGCWSKVSLKPPEPSMTAAGPDAQPSLHYRWVDYLSGMSARKVSHDTMCQVVEEAGLDPETATSDDLDALGSYHPVREGEDDPEDEAATTWLEEFENNLVLAEASYGETDSMYDSDDYLDWINDGFGFYDDVEDDNGWLYDEV